MNLPRTLLSRAPAPLRLREPLRAAAGALLGVAAAGGLARLLVEGQIGADPLIVAPIGASAVLVFAVPASPLAQPRAVLGGNVVSALAGVSCTLLISHPALAAACAVAAAIFAMSLLGCLHPPGGAVALGAALALSGGGEPLGYGYALAPVGVCSALLVLAGMVYGRLSGHAYPHRVAAAPSPHDTADPAPDRRFGYTPADLDAALAQYGELLDVAREDLDALFRQVELQAHRRLHAEIACGEVMSRDVIKVLADQSCESALAFLREHDLRAAPVIDAAGRCVGMARRAELAAGTGKPVEAVLDPFVHKVRPGTPIEALMPLLSSGAAHEAMVVDEDRVLVGVITQTDLLAVLYRAHVVEAVVSARGV
ncbi:MAG: HPP family protein [Pseudomonadota bacterium]